MEPLGSFQMLPFAKPRMVAASEIYIQQGKVFKKIFFIKKGILRSYYITESGEEKTIFFRWEGQMAAVPECIFDQEPTRQIWQALEDCELLEIDFDLVEKMSENNFTLVRTRMGFAQKMLLESLKRVESFVLDKPEMRYQKLIAQKPEIIKRVADKHIASFIGVTPVSLSRIRKRLASQKK
ncbi:MAG: Crp/Fnr family transcriptional regulator [Bacteroidetes bacterium]|nr:Crp/Fnr family transcriptional regulator [Bacteroidota bacterium]